MHSTAADQRVGWRCASAADIDCYYGERPRQTLRAVVLTLNGAPNAVIGIARQSGYAQLFSEYKPEFRPHLRSMSTLRALKHVMAMIEESKLPVYAIAEDKELDSVRILTRLGFVPEKENVFRWQP
jgi:hypothetical protein